MMSKLKKLMFLLVGLIAFVLGVIEIGRASCRERV